ncbi:MAG: mechanosensitive ion channel domain-containing protein [Acidimicrobiales bacterium]
MDRTRVGIDLVVVAAAVTAYGIGFHFGGEMHASAAVGQNVSQVESSNHLHRLLAYILAGAWLLLATYAVRQIANQLAKAISLADKATAASIRLILTLIGLVVVLLMALAILRIGVSQLLLGGAITGIILGIAAQQSLGNVFAAIVLLLARPFRAGDFVRVRTGSLGGPLEGHVVSVGLIYVVFSTEEGMTLVPNLTLLASGIVRSPRPSSTQAPLTAPVVPTPPRSAQPETVQSATAQPPASEPGSDTAPGGTSPVGESS